MFAELLIPNVTIRPSAEETQMFINKSVQSIIAISKSIYQWNQDGRRVTSDSFSRLETSIEVPSSDNESVVATQTNPNEFEDNPLLVNEPIPNVESSTRDAPNDVPTHRTRGNTMLTIQEFIQPVKPQFSSGENFFKLISENKEINKLVGQLATCISVIKKVKGKRMLATVRHNFGLGHRRGVETLRPTPTPLAEKSGRTIGKVSRHETRRVRIRKSIEVRGKSHRHDQQFSEISRRWTFGDFHRFERSFSPFVRRKSSREF